MTATGMPSHGAARGIPGRGPRLWRAGRWSQGGVTLIEVLVAILILMIGLLGLAALQTQGLRANHSAYMRAQATTLAGDILDRMRADRAAAIGGAYDRALTADPPSAEDCRDPDELEDMGNLDLWLCSLVVSLPESNGAIERTGAAPIFVITVEWDDTRGGQAAQQFQLRSEL